MKTYKEFMSESRFISEKFLKIAKAAFNDKVVKKLSKDSLRRANELPREIPNRMKSVDTGPFPKREIDSQKAYLRNVRQGYIEPTPEPIKGMTGATSIGKPKATGMAIHPDRFRLPKHEKARGVKTKGVKYRLASGNKGIENLINPYEPSFNAIPANTTEPAVGASTCASGNQI